MRDAGIGDGAELRVHVAEEGCLVLETPAHALRRARARIMPAGARSVVDEFLAERAAEVTQ